MMCLAHQRHDRLQILVLLIGHKTLPPEIIARLHLEAGLRAVVVLGVAAVNT
jgi:hypothetical protein